MSKFLALVLLSLVLSLASSMTLSKRFKLKTRNWCRKPANLINWGRNLTLRVLNTISDSNNVPVLSDVEIDTVSDWTNYDAWCVSADVYIQSFTNGLCLNTDDGVTVIAKAHCTMKWTIVGDKAQGYVEFTTVVNGKKLSLTAHQNDNQVTLEECLPEDDKVMKAFQLWTLHYP